MAGRQLNVYLNIKDNATRTIKDLNRELKNTENELKLCNEKLKTNGNSTELLAQKQQILANRTELYNRKVKETSSILKASSIELQKKKLSMEVLEKELKDLTAQYTKYRNELGEEDKLTKKTLTTINKKQKELRKQSKEYDSIASSVQKYNTQLTRVQIDQEKTSRAFAETSLGADKLGTSLENMSNTDLSRLADDAMRLGMSLGTVLATLSALGAKADMSFEYGNVKINTIAKLDTESLTQMGDEIRKLSDDSGVAISEIQEAYYQALSSGMQFSQVNALVTESIKTSKAGFSDLTGTIDVATSIMNAWKLGVEDTGRVMNALYKTTELGKVTMKELSADLGKVVASASQSGLEIEQVLSAVAQASLSGIKSNEGITYLNSMLNEMAKSGTTVSNIIKKEMGMSFQDAVKSGKELSQIIDVIESSGTSLTDAFGSQEAGRMASVLADGKSYLNLLNDIRNSSGSVNDAFSKVNTTQYAEFEQTINRLKNSLIDLGVSSKPLLEMFIDGVESVSEGLQKVDTNTVKTLTAVSALSIGLGGLFKVGGKVNGLMSTLGIKSVPSFTDSIKSLLAGGLNPLTIKLGLAAGAIGAVVVAYDAFTVSVAEQREKVDTLAEGYNNLLLELESLQGLDNPTQYQQEQIGLLEQELKLKQELLKVEKERLSQKDLFGKGVIGLGSINDADGKIGNVSIISDTYNQTKDYYNEVKNSKDATQEVLNSYLESLRQLKDKMLVEQNALLDEKKRLNEQLGNLIEPKEIKKVQDKIAEIDNSLKLASSITGINLEDSVAGVDKTVDKLEEVKKKSEEFTVSLTDQANKIDNLSKASQTVISNLSGLNSAIEQVTKGNSLSSESMQSLLNDYPQLINELIKTENGYTLNSEALKSVRDETLTLQRDAIESEIAMTQIKLKNTSSRIGLMATEIEGIKSLADAYRVLEGAKSSSGNQIFGMGYRPATYKEEFNQEEQAIIDLVQSYGKLQDQLTNWDVVTSIAPSSSANKSKSSSSKTDDKFKKEIESIQKHRKQIEHEISLLESQIDIDSALGVTDESKYSKMTTLLDKLKAVSSQEIQSYQNLAKLYTKEDELSELEELIADANKQRYVDEKQYIEHINSLLEKKKDILSAPISDMDLTLSSYESNLKILEATNATYEQQIALHNKIAEQEDVKSNYLKETIGDLYEQRNVLDSTSQQYKKMTEIIVDMENQLASSLQSQVDARTKIMDLVYQEMEVELERSIYGENGKSSWEEANDKRIESLNKELDLLKKQTDEKKKQQEAEERALEIKKLEEQLENTKRQKDIRVFKKQADGSHQWVYEYDATKVANLESQIAQKRKEEEQRLEDEKIAAKEQSLRDEISLLQKEKQEKDKFFNQSKEDLKNYLDTNKEAILLNGEEVLGVVTNNMDLISEEFNGKMDGIVSNLQDKLSQITAMFNEAMSMGSSMGSIGGGKPGDKTYSSTGGSGKTYFQYSDGSIEVLRPNGSSSTVKPGDKNYNSTVDSMIKDKVDKKYANGGNITKTGLAWVDGSLNKPERVLSASQNESFEKLVENLPKFDFAWAKMMGSANGALRLNPSATATSVSSRIENLYVTLPNVRDGKGFTDELNAYVNGIATNLLNKSSLLPSGEY